MPNPSRRVFFANLATATMGPIVLGRRAFAQNQPARMDAIALTSRSHMNQDTLTLYNQMRSAEGVVLGLGELFAPRATGQRFDPLYKSQIQRWRELYVGVLPASYEFEIGEGKSTSGNSRMGRSQELCGLGRHCLAATAAE